MISLIVAASQNGVIGVDGDLPWRLPDDLRRFKALTTGKPVIMGRKTWDSIGRPLPKRQNIVISRNTGFAAEGCDIVTTPEQAIAAAGDSDEIMIIGGGTIYAIFLDKATRIYLTRVHADIDGDTFFLGPDPDVWIEESRTTHPADERHSVAFDFIDYVRR
ncbi:MAG: dihydrofolate reductase [Pseudomonadota bacterium]